MSVPRSGKGCEPCGMNGSGCSRPGSRRKRSCRPCSGSSSSSESVVTWTRSSRSRRQVLPLPHHTHPHAPASPFLLYSLLASLPPGTQLFSLMGGPKTGHSLSAHGYKWGSGGPAVSGQFLMAYLTSPWADPDLPENWCTGELSGRGRAVDPQTQDFPECSDCPR